MADSNNRSGDPEGAQEGHADGQQARSSDAPSVAAASVCLSGVRFVLDGQTILENLSLELSERRIGLIGRNGSGKSTLARLISGLTSPDEGMVRIHGVDVDKDREAAIRTIGLIFQNPDHQIIFPTVEEEIAFGLENLGRSKPEARVRARQCLAAFGRGHWAERSTFALSQGQRHLVCLMAVLAMEPKVILLDEPFAGLDWPTAHHLFHWLDRLDQQLILVTHEIERLETYDRLIWLEAGQVVGDGKPSEVLPAYRAAMQQHLETLDLDGLGEAQHGEGC